MSLFSAFIWKYVSDLKDKKNNLYFINIKINFKLFNNTKELSRGVKEFNFWLNA